MTNTSTTVQLSHVYGLNSLNSDLAINRWKDPVCLLTQLFGRPNSVAYYLNNSHGPILEPRLVQDLIAKEHAMFKGQTCWNAPES